MIYKLDILFLLENPFTVMQWFYIQITFWYRSGYFRITELHALPRTPYASDLYSQVEFINYKP